MKRITAASVGLLATVLTTAALGTTAHAATTHAATAPRPTGPSSAPSKAPAPPHGKPDRPAAQAQDPDSADTPGTGISPQNTPVLDLPPASTVKLSGKELSKLQQLKAKLDELIKIHSRPANGVQPKLDMIKDHSRDKVLALLKSTDEAVTKILAKAGVNTTAPTAADEAAIK